MLLKPALSPIQLDVAPLKFNESTFHQRTQPSELNIKFLPDGCCELLLTMPRFAYGTNGDGSIGDPVPAGYLTLEPVRLRGDRNVAVDPNDGFPRYRLRTRTTALNTITQLIETFPEGQDWEAFLEALPGTYMLQDRYFGDKCAKGQVNIYELLQLYAAQADAAPSLFAVEQPVPQYAPLPEPQPEPEPEPEPAS